MQYDIDILVKCNWVATRQQQYSTHLHTNSTQNDTKQKIYRKTQKLWKECGPCPVFAGYILVFGLITEEKAREKNLSQGSRIVLAGTMKIHKYTIRIHRHNNKNIYITVLKGNTTNMAVLYYFISILVKVSDGGLNRDRNM